MPPLRLDPAASSLLLRTRAAGVLARLAHDLEIRAADLSGHASADPAGPWTAELQIPVGSLRVAGTLHGDTLDPHGLSPSDRAEVERKLREEVLVGTRAVRVRASGPTRDRADARVEVAQGAGTVHTRLAVSDLPGGAVHVTGSCPVSLRTLSIREVKGPLGAFKLKDEVEIRFDLTLRPETP